MEAVSPSEVIIGKHQELLRVAAQHRFCDACSKGTIAPEQFNRWLTQAFYFVRALSKLVDRVLALAPYENQDVLGMTAAGVEEEIAWFRVQAEERDIDLYAAPCEQSCSDYCSYLTTELQHAPYSVQYAALFAVLYVYNVSWMMPGAFAAPYSKFSERWGGTNFSEFLSIVQSQVDDVVASISDQEHAMAEDAVLRVLQYYPSLWEAAYRT